MILGFYISPVVNAAPDIEVIGNKKTKTAYIKKLVNICLRDFEESSRHRNIRAELDDELLIQTQGYYLQRCLNSSGLFASVNIEWLEPDKISIWVSDKISFLALPSYNAGPEPISVYWGVLIFDFNAGGKGQLVGALYDRQNFDNADSYSLLYDIPYVDQEGRYGFNMVISDTKRFFYSYQGQGWNYRVRERFRFLWLRLKHRLNPQFSLTYGYAPTSFEFSNAIRIRGETQEEAEIANPQQDIQGITFNVEWKNLERQFYYDKGFSFSNTLFHQLSNSQKEAETASWMRMYWGVPSVGQHVFQGTLDLGTRSEIEPYSSWRLGGDIGERSVPRDSFWSQHFATSSFDYQLPIVQGRYGYWNFGPFIDLGYLWNVQHNEEKEFGYYSLGIASYLHLRRINVPAIGVSFGTNSRYGNGYASIYIGYQLN